MAIRICLGKYAKKGYEPEHMGSKVYSIEELCYFIKENAFLIDENFACQELGLWLQEQCGLKELGEQIQRISKRPGRVLEVVGILLDYAGFLSKEEVEEIKDILSANSSRTVFEKKKAKADALVEKGFYMSALGFYRELLRELSTEEVKLRGALHHGCGVCYARLFYFARAGQEFYKAYELSGQVKSYRQYLWTKRFSMRKKEFTEFVREHREAYEDSVEMEEMQKELKENWQQSPKGLVLREMKEKKQELSEEEYQSMLKERVMYLKDAYMEMIK